MGNRYLGRLLLTIAVVMITIANNVGAAAQSSLSINIDYIKEDRFPIVEALVSISDAQGFPVSGIDAESFTVSEDGRAVKKFEVSEIQNTEQALAIALVVDVSGSMGSRNPPSPLDRAGEAAQTFVSQLAPQDQIAVVKFANESATVQPLTTDKNAVQASLKALEPEGNQTAMYDAVIEAVNLLKGFAQRRIIVLVTDGRDTGRGSFNFDQAMREAESWSIPIYPLGFGNKIDRDELTRMAKLTGGVVQLQPDASQLQVSFDAVLRLLREEYLIRYVSAFPADEKQHTLQITATYQGTQLQASRLYTAHSSQILVSLPGYETHQTVGGIEYFRPTTDWPTPLKQLDIKVDGALLASIQNPPFEYRWDSTRTQEETQVGEHEFSFVLTDVAGNSGQTTLVLDVQDPITVRITNPSAGATLRGSVAIRADVRSLPDVPLGAVDVTVDGQPIGRSLTAPPYEVKWTLAGVPAGRHIITVTAHDTDGRITAADEETVNVAVGSYGWMIVLIVLLSVAGVTIPPALRRRRQMGALHVSPISPGPAFLLELDGLNPNRSWPLGENDFRLGRKHDANDLPLKGTSASRKHAIIRLENGHYVIYALNWNNPVLIKNQPVSQKRVLEDGDVIQLGETRLRFQRQ